jgi:hypothetical protein
MKKLLLSIVFILAALPVAMAQSTGTAKLKGQVVCCVDCWAKADRKITPYGTRLDLKKAKECVGNGAPTLLTVANDKGNFTFYQLELGKYNRPGKNWLDYRRKRIEVTGATGKKKDTSYIKGDTLPGLVEPTAATEKEVNIIGMEAELALNDLFGVESA